MSLDWSIADIRNHEEVRVCYDPYRRNEDLLTRDEIENSLKTEALIWLTIGVGMNQITEANHEQFAARVIAWELVHGPYLRLNDEPHSLTLADVKRRIGLSTNASKMTLPQFKKSLADHVLGKSERIVNADKEAAEEVVA